MKTVETAIIQIMYEQNEKHEWDRVPKELKLNGEVVDLDKVRQFILSFQPENVKTPL